MQLRKYSLLISTSSSASRAGLRGSLTGAAGAGVVEVEVEEEEEEGLSLARVWTRAEVAEGEEEKEEDARWDFVEDDEEEEDEEVRVTEMVGSGREEGARRGEDEGDDRGEEEGEEDEEEVDDDRECRRMRLTLSVEGSFFLPLQNELARARPSMIAFFSRVMSIPMPSDRSSPVWLLARLFLCLFFFLMWWSSFFSRLSSLSVFFFFSPAPFVDDADDEVELDLSFMDLGVESSPELSAASSSIINPLKWRQCK
jgi:hypothetical protein